MAVSMNRVFLGGRVISDPEGPRTLESGSSVIKFRMAVGRSKKNPTTGQWENDPNTLYIDVEAWHSPQQKRNMVDVIAKYVKKGDQVIVEGELRIDEWDDRNGGGKRSKHKVSVTDVQLIGGGKLDQQEEGRQEQSPRQQAPQQQRRPQSARAEQTDYDADIPFAWLLPSIAALSSIGSAIV